MLDYYHQKIADGLIDPPEETPEILEEQQQIWDYIPLVRGVAVKYARYCNLGYMDLCQQGYLILAELTAKIDWSNDSKMISKYVSTSLVGLMKNYMAKYNGIVNVPRLDANYKGVSAESIRLQDTEELADSGLNAEEECLASERREQLRQVVTAVVPTLNEREHFILFSLLLTDDPVGYREVAEQFKCGKTSVGRDVERILTRLREVMNANIQ